MARFEDITEEQWDETMRVHLKGTFNGTQAVLPMMKQQRSGKIINLIGPAALRPSNGVSDYASAKGGIITLTSNVANEMKPHNIQINCISPVADTRMTDAIAEYREREGIPGARPSPSPPRPWRRRSSSSRRATAITSPDRSWGSTGSRRAGP